MTSDRMNCRCFCRSDELLVAAIYRRALLAAACSYVSSLLAVLLPVFCLAVRNYFLIMMIISYITIMRMSGLLIAVSFCILLH